MKRPESAAAVLPTAFALTCRRCGRAPIVAVGCEHADGMAVWRNAGSVFARIHCCKTDQVFRVTTALELLPCA